MAKSVYIHIPFCKSKCKYCSFISFTNQEYKNLYLESLIAEIKSAYKGESLKTLYFGGGTPSLIPFEYLKKIIDCFTFEKECEITLEINPDDVEEKYLNDLKLVGINRLSLGAQTFNDDILKQIGRRHNSAQILKTIDLAKKVGFKNISADLIYGLPNQSVEILKNDLNNFVELDIQHISTYGLKVEEESYWGKNPPENLPDDDIQADMYLIINNFLEKNGYIRYEISNFARKGFESKHNLNYWNNEEYYGFGLSAHGYLEGVRYSNFCNLQDYINNTFKRIDEHFLTEQEKLEEEIFLGFRKEVGIDVELIQKKFKVDFCEKYSDVLRKFSPDYILKTPRGYKLTLQGVLLSNNILSEFI